MIQTKKNVLFFSNQITYYFIFFSPFLLRIDFKFVGCTKRPSTAIQVITSILIFVIWSTSSKHFTTSSTSSLWLHNFAPQKEEKNYRNNTNEEMNRSKQIELFWLVNFRPQYLLIRFHIFRWYFERLRAQNVCSFHFSILDMYVCTLTGIWV